MHADRPKRNRLADRVVSQIRDMVAQGTYGVGDRLPNETDLSELLGVGRSTIREAMRVLSNRGLVDVRHGEGTYVAARNMRESLEERLGRSELADIYEARLMLESSLSVLAARRRDAKDISAMRKCLKQRDAAIRAGDVAAYANADFAFHLAIAKAAKSPALFEVYESFVQSVQPRLESATTPDYIRNERDALHGALCDAIAEGNVTETRRLVRSHLNKSGKDLGNTLA